MPDVKREMAVPGGGARSVRRPSGLPDDGLAKRAATVRTGEAALAGTLHDPHANV
ncbi:hypothetical protein [Cohnella sp. REN36]|uniref:hypothetical protein n=1 Tax=Cohnella sp. REN36 TaxID=2887347 RepID=UPI001D15D286|nr:hypothetical protein [Cohnella sp. REN36]MCC3375031.1 hypothetical protein [Cohnella sp. REN36]